MGNLVRGRSSNLAVKSLSTQCVHQAQFVTSDNSGESFNWEMQTTPYRTWCVPIPAQYDAAADGPEYRL